jgi:hypothetical protein
MCRIVIFVLAGDAPSGRFRVSTLTHLVKILDSFSTDLDLEHIRIKPQYETTVVESNCNVSSGLQRTYGDHLLYA